MKWNYRKASKEQWENSTAGIPSLEQINVGSLQRIADALEKLTDANKNVEHYQRLYFAEREKSAKLRRKLRAVKNPPSANSKGV